MKQMQSKEGAFKNSSASSVLTKDVGQRWIGIDGNISFKEFFWAFQQWIGAEDGTEDEQ